MSDVLCLVVACLVSAIVGSQALTAKEGEMPFQVSVRNYRTNRHLCSGLLLTRKSVLTIGRCMPLRGEVKVSAGSVYLSKQRGITSTKIHVHYDYHYGYPGNDIAIIMLSDSFPESPTVQQAKLPVKDVGLVNETKLSGWNKVAIEDDVLEVFDNITVWGSDCRKVFNLTEDLSPDEFCTEDSYVSTSGSLLSKNGIVYGLLVERTDQMQRLTLLSHHSDWIKSILGNESSEVDWIVKGNTSSSLRPSVRLFVAFFLILLYSPNP